MRSRWAVSFCMVLTGCFPPEPGGDQGLLAEPAWVVAAPMHHPRTNHRSIVLDDGRVMVFGGYGFVDGQLLAIASVEVYDPIADVWSDLPDMQLKRADFAATLLPDGKVLLTGGTDGAPHYHDKAEIYDPVSGPVGGLISMNHAHVVHTATLLVDKGRVLIVGGRGDFSTDIIEMFDIATGTFALPTFKAPLRKPDTADYAHHAHTTTLLNSGQVLIVGGYDPYGPLNVMARVEPNAFDSNFWSSSIMALDARTRHVATALPKLCVDGTPSQEAYNVLVAGGEGFSSARFDDAGIINWQTNQWQDPPPPRMRDARSSAAGAVANGYYVVSGGLDATSSALKASERYDACSRSWFPLPDMKDARSGHTADDIGQGRVLVAGGYDGVDCLGTTEVLWPNAACTSQYDCSDGNSCSAVGLCMKQNPP